MISNLQTFESNEKAPFPDTFADTPDSQTNDTRETAKTNGDDVDVCPDHYENEEGS